MIEECKKKFKLSAYENVFDSLSWLCEKAGRLEMWNGFKKPSEQETKKMLHLLFEEEF